MNEFPTIKRVSEGVIPAAAFQAYPRNQWYVAAGRSELGGELLSRYLLGDRVLLFRKTNGDPVAMSDWCPHRGFALSASYRLGDEVRCGYHGMTFNAEGKCTHIPSQKALPSAMRVKTYPVVDKWLWTWIWMGDPAKADPSLIPVTPYEERDNYSQNFFFCHPIDGNFQLLHDNLLDATHVTFLHGGYVDNEGSSDISRRPEPHYRRANRLLPRDPGQPRPRLSVRGDEHLRMHGGSRELFI